METNENKNQPLSNQEGKSGNDRGMTEKDHQVTDEPTGNMGTSKNQENEKMNKTSGGSESTQTTHSNSGMGAREVPEDENASPGSNTHDSR